MKRLPMELPQRCFKLAPGCETLVTDHYAAPLSALDLQMILSVPPGGNWRNIPPTIHSDRLVQIRATAASGQGSRSTYYGRLQWEKPAYTISTYINRPGNGCHIHPAADRLITVREAARLQSFPDSFQFRGRIRSRQTQVGNAVPPLLAYQLAKFIPVGKCVDAFCGAGGMALGLQWAGFECIAAVDNDSSALESFQTNISDQAVIDANLADRSSYGQALDTIRERLGKSSLELLVGGPPCQGFSTAGNNSRVDERNQLVWAFLRLVEDLNPSFVLMENVPALAWKGRNALLKMLLGRLASSGYATATMIAHAEGYGVPQLRRRLFLFAWRSSSPAHVATPCYQILDPAYRKQQPGTTRYNLGPPVTVRDAIGDLPVESTGNPDNRVAYADEPRSEYSRWLRGELELESLLPPTPVSELSGAAPLIID